MRAMFGVVSLLVALAIIGLLAVDQLRAAKRGASVAAPAATSAEASVTGASPAANVRDQSRQLQQKISADLNQALEQGAKRTEDADK